jgi:Zn-dependent protease with chaperone function
MSGMVWLETAAAWFGRNAWLTVVPAVLIGWVWWLRWGSARVRWVLAGLLLVKLVMPELPGWRWSMPLPKVSNGAVATGVPELVVAAEKTRAVSFESASAVVEGPAWWAVAWGLGVLFFGGVWVVSFGRVNGMIRKNRVATPAWLVRLVEEEAQRLGLRESPELCVLRGWGQAAVHGGCRARVLLPASWVQGLGEEELRAVLRHELAHVRRKDVLWSTLGYAVAALHWFHPLGWLALRRLRAEAELLCDDAALTGHGEAERLQYGRVLIRMMETFASPPPRAVAAFARHRNDIQHRILMIAQPNRAQRWSRAAAWLILPTLSLTLLTAGEEGSPKTEIRNSKDGERAREGARDGERAREGMRDGEREATQRVAPREGQRDGDKPREGAREGERAKEGMRDGERAREGMRDGDKPREGQRDGDKPREGVRDGERPKEGQRDGDKPREGAREGERPREGMREGEQRGTREGEGRPSAVLPATGTPPVVIQLNAAGEVVNSEGRVIPDAEVKQRMAQFARSRPGQEIVLRGEKETRYESLARVLNLLRGIDVRPTLGQ